MKKPLFITFEGPEGGGKSTQARLLAGALRRRGFSVVHTREPGGTSIAEAVRRVLLRPDGRVAPMTELLLYEAARAQHLAEIVGPALRRGDAVICERYTDSTEAYQGAGRGISLKNIRRLNDIATGGLAPLLTFLLDVPVEKGLAAARSLSKKIYSGGKISSGGDRLEREPTSFHERVRRGFLALARREPRRVRVISWEEGAENVHMKIMKSVETYLKK